MVNGENVSFVIIIDRVALAKQGDNALGSVRPCVRVSVRLRALSQLNRLSNKSHYQSKVIVSVSGFSGHMQVITRMRSIGF